MKKIISTYKASALGLILGIAAGFLYWKYVGCASGTCPITSSPIISSLYGGLLGLLIGNLFTTHKKEKA